MTFWGGRREFALPGSPLHKAHKYRFLQVFPQNSRPLLEVSSETPPKPPWKAQGHPCSQVMVELLQQRALSWASLSFGAQPQALTPGSCPVSHLFCPSFHSPISSRRCPA